MSSSLRNLRSNLRAFLLLSAVLFVPAAFAAEWLSDMASARAEAKQSGKPILADFQAVWCYSCYYMDRRVLNRPSFQEAAAGLVLAKLDVDTEEGRALREKHRVTFLPSYLLLDASGKEVGRIVGEQTERDFLDQLQKLLGPRELPEDRLQALLDSGELGQSVRLRKSLLKSNPELREKGRWKVISSRLDLHLAARDKNPEAAWEALHTLLDYESGCVLAYDVYRAQELVEKTQESRRKTLLEQQRARLEVLVNARVLGRFQDQCADFRTTADVLADTYEALGLKEEKDRYLDRVVAFLTRHSQGIGVGRDRNLDDNLRYFLETAKKNEELDKLYPRLIEAYPADYVYAHRYAKNLHGRDKEKEALEWVEKAEKLSYGANRIPVTLLKAEVLSKLNRHNEATALLNREISANRRRFPKEADRLREALKSLKEPT